MKLIIGGSYQGKLKYAARQFDLQTEEWVDGADCGWDEIYSCRGINHFHAYIKRCCEAGVDTTGLAEQLVGRNPDVRIISDELGYGVVPIEPFEREYRERTGRVCTELAAAADEVHRVVCGLGQVIKTAREEDHAAH